MAILLALVLAGAALAVERPPVRPEQQRAWLAGRLAADMRATGMFSTSETAETMSLVGSLTEEQVVLLARLYCLMREMVEQDGRLLVVELSETLLRLRRAIRRAYWELAAISPRCETLCQFAYASIPGWCARYRHVVPDWYFRGGCFVGPCRSVWYGGAYSIRAYRTYHDRFSQNGWRGGKTRFGGDVRKFRKAAQGSRPSHAAAKRHGHAKTPHGTATPTKHGPASKAKHGSPAGTAKHRGLHKGSHVAARPAKHGGSSPKARHGGPKAKQPTHSQPHRQQPKRGATHVKPAAHRQSPPQHAPHGQVRHKAGHARHK
jgi:hypothetical protein